MKLLLMLLDLLFITYPCLPHPSTCMSCLISVSRHLVKTRTPPKKACKWNTGFVQAWLLGLWSGHAYLYEKACRGGGGVVSMYNKKLQHSYVLHLSKRRASALLWHADMINRFWRGKHCGREGSWKEHRLCSRDPLTLPPPPPPRAPPCSLNTTKRLWNPIGCLQKPLLQAVNIYVNLPSH